MKRSTISVIKKHRKPGRPKTTGTGTLLGMRWHAVDLSEIDAWAKDQGLERTAAIRQLVRLGLKSVRKKT